MKYLQDMIDVVDAHALKTLPRPRIDSQTVSLFDTLQLARTLPARETQAG